MISSATNPRVKRVRSLQTSRGEREAARCFVLEGPTLLREALTSGGRVDEVFYTEQFADDPDQAGLLEDIAGRGAQLMEVTHDIMQRMADTRTPQGILAVVPFVQLVAPETASFILIVDAVRDPGNLGTIMRLGAGAAVPLVVFAPGTVDVYNPKVVRSAMGAHFDVATIPMDWGEIERRWSSRPIFLADSGGGTPLFRVDWTQPCALIVSDEAHGPGADALRLASQHVTIPMPGKTESLNVAMAAGILIFEMVRQRMESEGQPGAVA